MQRLVAGLLRAMGNKSRITAAGPDRGKDIVASLHGFGFESPRIVVEVKHRPKSSMGSQETRSFVGGRHADDKGLYVSTGGFTQDARYEAERAKVPATLMGLDELVEALINYYEQMDGRRNAKTRTPETGLLASGVTVRARTASRHRALRRPGRLRLLTSADASPPGARRGAPAARRAVPCSRVSCAPRNRPTPRGKRRVSSLRPGGWPWSRGPAHSRWARPSPGRCCGRFKCTIVDRVHELASRDVEDAQQARGGAQRQPFVGEEVYPLVFADNEE